MLSPEEPDVLPAASQCGPLGQLQGAVHPGHSEAGLGRARGWNFTPAGVGMLESRPWQLCAGEVGVKHRRVRAPLGQERSAQGLLNAGAN